MHAWVIWKKSTRLSCFTAPAGQAAGARVLHNAWQLFIRWSWRVSFVHLLRQDWTSDRKTNSQNSELSSELVNETLQCLPVQTRSDCDLAGQVLWLAGGRAGAPGAAEAGSAAPCGPLHSPLSQLRCLSPDPPHGRHFTGRVTHRRELPPPRAATTSLPPPAHARRTHSDGAGEVPPALPAHTPTAAPPLAIGRTLAFFPPPGEPPPWPLAPRAGGASRLAPAALRAGGAVGGAAWRSPWGAGGPRPPPSLPPLPGPPWSRRGGRWRKCGGEGAQGQAGIARSEWGGGVPPVRTGMGPARGRRRGLKAGRGLAWGCRPHCCPRACQAAPLAAPWGKSRPSARHQLPRRWRRAGDGAGLRRAGQGSGGRAAPPARPPVLRGRRSSRVAPSAQPGAVFPIAACPGSSTGPVLFPWKRCERKPRRFHELPGFPSLLVVCLL